MRVEVLIQNVSWQCIPNLVAAETYKPQRIIWVYSKETESVLRSFKQACKHITSHQDEWLVEPRDSEKLDAEFARRFQALRCQGKLVYHMTGGTKSMSLQGLQRLILFGAQGPDVQAVVMDASSQQFDVLYPQPHNNDRPCASLDFAAMLGVHQCRQQQGSGISMLDLVVHLDVLRKLRLQHKSIERALRIRPNKARRFDVCNKEQAQARGYYLLDDKKRTVPLPAVVVQGLQLAEQAGAIHDLRTKNGMYFSFKAGRVENPIDYIRNTWMEEWVGAVLADHDAKAWQGGFSSVKVMLGEQSNEQEFDFLGACRNKLVYWSCKNTQELKTEHIFEVAALKDNLCGSDMHVAGLLHTFDPTQSVKGAESLRTMEKKAKRLNVRLLCVDAEDAEAQLIRTV